MTKINFCVSTSPGLPYTAYNIITPVIPKIYWAGRLCDDKILITLLGSAWEDIWLEDIISRLFHDSLLKGINLLSVIPYFKFQASDLLRNAKCIISLLLIWRGSCDIQTLCYCHHQMSKNHQKCQTSSYIIHIIYCTTGGYRQITSGTI